MGKLQGNRKPSARRSPLSQKSSKSRAPRSRPDSSLGFPSISLDELVKRQGVKPVADLQEFASLWPTEFDPDEFLTWLSAERVARRHSAVQARRESD